ncbi:hypothetical protein SB659_00860 [Arthrobacter sp. SIMBA_036]|uniref:hypothetical protein n=1 Tax=Arthrobacter sp. SIMBA_036 TaxID=3085778 RepID=UPI00397AC187
MINVSAVSALSSYHWLGIPIAVAGAVLLALGTLFQHKAVEGQEAAPGRAAGSMGGGRPHRGGRPEAWAGAACRLSCANLFGSPGPGCSEQRSFYS